MSNPAIVVCPVNAWTKVATNVAAGVVYRITGRKLYQTYRVSGGAAPTDLTEAVDLVTPADAIESSQGIDVYIYSKDEAGSVRVDV